ncbi:MAG: orotidine-5'-phosphate decarboxylase [Synechococcales cyanobacterium]
MVAPGAQRVAMQHLTGSEAGLDHVMVALDVPNAAAALALVERLPQVRWWKVGLELFMAEGSRLLPLLKTQQKGIFLDVKLHDIPNTVAGAVRAAVRYEVDFLSVHASGGIPMLQQAQEATVGSSCRLLAITLLTSISPAALATQLHISESPTQYVQHLAAMAQSVGIPGVVCSPQEAAALRTQVGADLCLVTPGIRLGTDASGDQARVWTPAAARQAGVNFIVVGRPITQAADPALALATYVRHWSDLPNPTNAQ